MTDEEAWAKVSESQGLIRKTVGHYVQKNYTLRHMRQDLESVGREAVFKAAKTYDPSKARFTTYASRVMCRMFDSYVRDDMIQQSMIPRRHSARTAAPPPTASVSSDDRSHEASLDDGPPDVGVLRLLDELSPTDRAVVTGRYFEELSIQELAERHGFSRDWVERRLRRANEQLRVGDTK